MEPYHGDSFSITVGPKESKTVIIKQVDTGFSMGSSTITKVSHGEKTLKKLTKEQGQAQHKKDKASG